jgi:hypothetical protein
MTIVFLLTITFSIAQKKCPIIQNIEDIAERINEIKRLPTPPLGQSKAILKLRQRQEQLYTEFVKILNQKHLNFDEKKYLGDLLNNIMNTDIRGLDTTDSVKLAAALRQLDLFKSKIEYFINLRRINPGASDGTTSALNALLKIHRTNTSKLQNLQDSIPTLLGKKFCSIITRATGKRTYFFTAQQKFLKAQNSPLVGKTVLYRNGEIDAGKCGNTEKFKLFNTKDERTSFLEERLVGNISGTPDEVAGIRVLISNTNDIFLSLDHYCSYIPVGKFKNGAIKLTDEIKKILPNIGDNLSRATCP